jgi:hypothetical protein
MAGGCGHLNIAVVDISVTADATSTNRKTLLQPKQPLRHHQLIIRPQAIKPQHLP